LDINSNQYDGALMAKAEVKLAKNQSAKWYSGKQLQQLLEFYVATIR
jgi:hypothetical protein